MAVSTKKKCYLVALMVSTIVLTLCSASWSKQKQPLMCYMSDTYVLNLALDDDARAAAEQFLNTSINPILEADGQDPLMSLGIGVLMIQDRHNLRDDDGRFILPGEDVVVALFLLVLDPSVADNPADPFPLGTSILLVKSFNNNIDTLNYLIDKGIHDPAYHASEIEVTHKAKQREESSIQGKIRVNDEDGTVEFMAEFIPPKAYPQPEEIPPEDPLSWEVPYRLRYEYDPARLFSISVSSIVYEPAIAEVVVYLNINVSNPIAGAIFNSPTSVTRLRFIRQIGLIEEIP